MKVNEFMTNDVITCNENSTVGEVAEIMFSNDIGAVPVVNNDGDVTGIISESNFICEETSVPHAMVNLKILLGVKFHSSDIEDVYRKTSSRKVKDVMSKPIISIPDDASLTEVLNKMMVEKVKRLIVLNSSGKLAGIVTKRDVVQAYINVNK